MRMKMSHVVAINTKRVIGLNGQLPWHVPSDLKHFKSQTMGKILLMGRKTYESVGKPLPGRMNLIVTSSPEKFPEGPRLKAFTTIEAAIAFGKTVASQWKDELCIVGGGEIYRQTMESIDTIYVTVIEQECPGDTFYPIVPEQIFRLASVTPLSPTPSGGQEPKSDLFIYERI